MQKHGPRPRSALGGRAGSGGYVSTRKKKFVVVATAGAVVLIGGAAFAGFSGQGKTTSNGKAATVAVEVTGGQLSGGDCDNLLPGESCSGTFTAKNTGTVSEVFAESVAQTAATCYTVEVALEDGKVDTNGDTDLDYNPGQSGTGTITMTLNETADNTCQGVANVATVTVNAAVSKSPRN